jgi:hypothetical protein
MLLGVVAALMLVGGCDDKTKSVPRPAPSMVPASPSSVASVLGIDAGAFVDTADPPPPAGDLKADLDRFVNVETCVKERANVDPLVGDGLRAIGYDTFLRDVCRLLEAAKDKKREACDRIDSSSMRARCQSWVAMVAQTPDACPLQLDAIATRGRDVTCLAVAGKDPRLCSGEQRTAVRAICDALASRDESRCNVLIPPDRPGCTRELTRWRSLLAPPLTGMPALPAARGKLVVKGDSGTADPPTPEADLSTEFARGAVVVTSRERARVELGMIGESETSRIAPSPNRRARLGIALLLEPGATPKDPPKPLLERLELEIPGETTLVYPGVHCDCRVTTARVDRTRGGEIALGLQGTISAGSRSYRVDADLVTFVRDVVSEQGVIGGATRVLPPVHPSFGPRTDAGTR